MVPVPEGLVEQVETLLFQLKFRASAPAWDQRLMTDHIGTLDVSQRSLLALVAAGVRSHGAIEDTVVAEQLGLSVSDLFLQIRECNKVTVGANPGDLVHARQEAAVGGGDPRRVLYMIVALADLVHDTLADIARSPGKVETIA